jgi:hypothetical protein
MKQRIIKNLLKLALLILVIVLLGYVMHTFGVVMGAML